jgi:peroxiredoxin
VAAMPRAVADLRASDIALKVLKVGARAPEFTLPNAVGMAVESRRLLANGPLVVTFYRGRW